MASRAHILRRLEVQPEQPKANSNGGTPQPEEVNPRSAVSSTAGVVALGGLTELVLVSQASSTQLRLKV
jgi:hypothetical protein